MPEYGGRSHPAIDKRPRFNGQISNSVPLMFQCNLVGTHLDYQLSGAFHFRKHREAVKSLLPM